MSLDEVLAPEVLAEQSAELRAEEARPKETIRRLELQLVEREQSAESPALVF